MSVYSICVGVTHIFTAANLLKATAHDIAAFPNELPDDQ
jgi:hypothetical protein